MTAAHTPDLVVTELPELSATDARTLTDQIRVATGQLCHLLRGAYEQRAHHALGYTRWEDYVEAEFSMSRTHSYLLLSQSRILHELEAVVPQASDPIVLTHREVQAIGPRLPQIVETVRERTIDATAEQVPQIVKQVVEEVRHTPLVPLLPTPPQRQEHPTVVPAVEDDDDMPPGVETVQAPRDRAVLGALYELPVTIRRLPEGLLFEITNPGHPLQGWCGLARGATGLAAVVHDMLVEAKKCEADLRAGKFYAPLSEVISGKPRESTYDPADYTPLPDGRWLTPSGRKYSPDSWVMRQVLAKRALLGLPTEYTHGDPNAA